MTGDVQFRLTAATLPLAIEKATERWRLFLDDPEAKLPWSAHFSVAEEERADDGSEMDVVVTITFDRTTFPTSEPAD